MNHIKIRPIHLVAILVLLAVVGLIVAPAFMPGGHAYSGPARDQHRSKGTARPSAALDRIKARNKQEQNLATLGWKTWVDQKDALEAERLLKDALAIDPEDPFVMSHLARIYRATGRESDEYKTLTRLMNPPPTTSSTFEEDPSLLLRWGDLAKTRHDPRTANEAYFRGANTAATDAFVRGFTPEEARKAKPSEIEEVAILRAAEWALFHEHDDESMSLYRRALKLDPSSVVAHYYYGLELQRKGTQKESDAELLKAKALAGGKGPIAEDVDREVRSIPRFYTHDAKGNFVEVDAKGNLVKRKENGK